MQRSERRRIAMGYGALGVLALAVIARLVQLQGAESAHALRRVARQAERRLELPAPRGTIVDRDGKLLAYDRPVVEVRAELHYDGDQPQAAVPEALADELAGELVQALFAAGGPRQLADERALLRGRLRGARPDPNRSRVRRKARGDRPAVYRNTIDFLVAADLESAAVIERLRAVERQRLLLTLHFLQRHERTYPDRDATVGPLGFVGDRRRADGSNARVYRGMEAFAGLQPGFGGWRKFYQDARARPYWTAERRQPDAPNVLECTLDLELQKTAQAELQAAVETVVKRYQSPPDWGAMLLVDCASGDVLAMASYRADAHPKIAAFAPTQCLFPPGSVVKPLVFALALERGVLDWSEPIDCTPTSGNAWYLPDSHRAIRDEHPAGLLTPPEVLVRSSNIGAVHAGLLLGREGLAEYVDRYGWGKPTGTGLPDEMAGACRTRRELLSMRERLFWIYSGPSLSFGYDANVTPLQLTRAYLTMLSGRERELRLFSRVVVAGEVRELQPNDRDNPRFLSPATLARVRNAMADVVSDAEHATGHALLEELRRVGVADRVIAGKTGTSEFTEERREAGGVQRIWVRTASFAGFAPVDEPRYLAVCVLQKDRAAAFWGGSYAAPAAGRLLLRALAREGGQPAVQGRQVSVGTPGRHGAGPSRAANTQGG
jgi:cell division protein FtsI/penicillin-binding protein 2